MTCGFLFLHLISVSTFVPVNLSVAFLVLLFIGNLGDLLFTIL